jgi:cytochrome c
MTSNWPNQSKKAVFRPYHLIAAGLLLLAPLRAIAAPANVKTKIASAPPPAAAACIACHATQGAGDMAGGWPRIGGLSATYLEAQLEAFATGKRHSDLMEAAAKHLTPEERKAIALYFSQQHLPDIPLTDTTTDPSHAGAWLANRGRWSNNLPACASCHGANGMGVGEYFPALSGLPSWYIKEQLHAWKKGMRPAGPLGLMGGIAAKLTEQDIDAVADYYTGPDDPLKTTLPSQHLKAPGLSALSSNLAIKQGSPAKPPSSTNTSVKLFTPPPESAIPNNDFGHSVKRGEQIFLHTPENARGFVGNRLTCANCHLDAGRKAYSAPLWAAFVAYPAYRSKNDQVNTLGERLQGCFKYSMNGKAPALSDPVLVDLQAYMYWLSQGAPVGSNLPGRGYPTVPHPPLKPDYLRGQAIYAQHCALCHGANGAGQTRGADQVFPPLWGAGSYNWGAGMHDVKTAAGFIKDNMPLSQPNTLTDQQAWDVALFVNSHERPQDPRFTGNVQETRQKYHHSSTSMYGTVVNGHLLGKGL